MNKLQTKSYMLSEEEILIIADLCERNNISASSALRIIIRDWADMKAGLVTIQKVGVIKDGKVHSDYLKYLEGPLDPRD